MGLFRRRSATQDPASIFDQRVAGLGPGVPGRCPHCDDLGYIDVLDVARQFQVQRCTGCGEHWEYRFGDDDSVVAVLDQHGHPLFEQVDDGDVVLDLRDRDPHELSPAEWLRLSR